MMSISNELEEESFILPAMCFWLISLTPPFRKGANTTQRATEAAKTEEDCAASLQPWQPGANESTVDVTPASGASRSAVVSSSDFWEN